MSGRYELLLSGAARRALERELPVAIALAVWEVCDGPLRENPRRVGKPLGRELTGYFAASLQRVADPARRLDQRTEHELNEALAHPMADRGGPPR